MNLPETPFPEYTPPPDLLRDSVILISGAGQGIGKSAALACAKHGATVILQGRNITKLENTYDQIEAMGGPQPAIMPLDYLKATQKELDAFADSIHHTLGRLDGMLHAAVHFTPLTPLNLQDLDTWQQHWTVNVAVPAALTRACMPLLKQSPVASVVFLTETHALKPAPYWGAFAASKSALSTTCAIWAAEAANEGIRINLLAPGPVASPMRAKSHPGETAASLPQIERLTFPILYLLGPDSAEQTGKCFVPIAT